MWIGSEILGNPWKITHWHREARWKRENVELLLPEYWGTSRNETSRNYAMKITYSNLFKLIINNRRHHNDAVGIDFDVQYSCKAIFKQKTIVVEELENRVLSSQIIKLYNNNNNHKNQLRKCDDLIVDMTSLTHSLHTQRIRLVCLLIDSVFQLLHKLQLEMQAAANLLLLLLLLLHLEFAERIPCKWFR